MNRKMLVAIALMLTMTATLAILPARAYLGAPYTGTPPESPIPTEDNKWDLTGPRMDNVLIKMYGSTTTEWEALRGGDIHITDWTLNKVYFDDFMGGAPVSTGVAVGDYGGEFGMWVLDLRNDPYINTNTNDIIGDPGDALNPLGDQTLIIWPGDVDIPGGTIVTRGSQARRAIAYLLDRDAIITATGALHNAMYTHVPVNPVFSLGGWISTIAKRYPFNVGLAATILTMAGYLDTDGNGVRNYDSDGDGLITAADADFIVDFYTRLDTFRATVGDWIEARLEGPAGGPIPNLADFPGGIISVNRFPGTGGFAWLNVMLNKVGHMYTAGWIMSKEPTMYFGLYNSAQYWHPGDPPNYMHVNDPALDAASNAVAYAPDIATAKVNHETAQQIMNDPKNVFGVPVANTAGRKAYRKEYSAGNALLGVVNAAGYGINTGPGPIDTLLNARQAASLTGGVLNYGWSHIDMPTSLNPFQYSWYWDAEVIFRVYNTIGGVNPMDAFGGGPGVYPSGDTPWAAYDWDQVIDPVGGTSTFTFWLRNDVFFHDGTQMTAKDIYYAVQFGHVQATDWPLQGWVALPPWFWSNIMDITPEFNPVDPTIVVDTPGVGVDMPDGPNGFKIVVTYNQPSVWAFWWFFLGIPIVPKAKWWDVFVTSTGLAPGSDGFDPDPQMIGTGPYKVYPGNVDGTGDPHYVPGSSVTLDKNPNFHNRVINPNYALYVDYDTGDIYIENLSATTQTATVKIDVYVDGAIIESWDITGVKVPGNSYGFTSVPKLSVLILIRAVTIRITVIILAIIVIQVYVRWILIIIDPLMGDLGGATKMFGRTPLDNKVNFVDLFWFLKAYGQTATRTFP